MTRAARSTAGVIATFNQVRYAREAVDSLLGQVDELIVVDDMSTDGTREVLASYGNRIHLLLNDERLGVSRSFNKGVAAASAEVVLIQGGDDRSAPDRAQRQATALHDGVALVASVPNIIGESGRRLAISAAPEFEATMRTDLAEYLYRQGNAICAPTVATSRSLWIMLGGFNPALDHLQDYHLWLLATDQGRVVVDPLPVADYRKHSSNLSRAATEGDSTRLRRIDAELAFARLDFIARASQGRLRVLAQAAGIEGQRVERMSVPSLRCAVELSHADPVVIRSGVNRLMAALTDPPMARELEEAGFSINDLDRLAAAADPRNRREVARAMRFGVDPHEQ